MTLHEQYETLKRRGMPEHPNLVFDKRGSNGFVPYLGCNLTHDYIASDLITMHAIKWWLGLKCGEPTTVAFGAEKLGVKIRHKCRDDALNREMTISAFAERSDGWIAKSTYVGTDVYEADHHDKCNRYRSHDMNEDETRYSPSEIGGNILSTILAATAHLAP